MDIMELLKKYGLEVLEDKAGEFDKEFRQSWKHHTKLDSKIKELDAARAELKTRDVQLTELKKVDASELQERISELEETNKTAQKQYEADTRGVFLCPNNGADNEIDVVSQRSLQNADH